LYLVSGDDETVTQTVAQRIGIDSFHGGLTPPEKAQFVARLQRNGHFVAMVGDGINDAPAMAKADVAVGIHGKNPLAKETADITLMRGDPGQLLEFFSLSRRVGKKIRQNFRFSFLYNIISIPIAMAGLLTPIIAVCAMLASSLSVIGNSLMLVEKGKATCRDETQKVKMPGKTALQNNKMKRISIRETGN
jgi:P-type E1-E2 ATPase